MAAAKGADCLPPEAPGPAHPQAELSQLFNASDNEHHSYLLGWEIEPYHGLGTYQFATGGDILALEPPTGGTPLGFGDGSVTFVGSPEAGTVHAVIKLKAGGTVALGGSWTCSAT